MLASDGCLYTVKFQSSPLHLRVSANELIGARLAEAVGLPVPDCRVVTVPDWLVINTPEIAMDLDEASHRCSIGPQFGYRFVNPASPNDVLDYMPEKLLGQIDNLHDFRGMLALDKWTSNADSRQAVFVKSFQRAAYIAIFTDHGGCFSGGQWKFTSDPFSGVFPQKIVYSGITGWESFEPWLTRIEEFEAQAVRNIASEVPPEWYGEDEMALESLLTQLFACRLRVREQIAMYRKSSSCPFPKWDTRVNKPAVQHRSAPIAPQGPGDPWVM